jgi:hypothetical protein
MQRTISWYSRPLLRPRLGDWLEPTVPPISWFCELYDPEGKRVGNSNGRNAGERTGENQDPPLLNRRVRPRGMGGSPKAEMDADKDIP